MRAFFAGFGLTAYLLAAVLVLFVYLPVFLWINSGLQPEISLRYFAATGVFMGATMITVVGLQSVMPRFSVLLALEVLIVGCLWWFVLSNFHHITVADLFGRWHLFAVGGAIAINLFQYARLRRQQEES